MSLPSITVSEQKFERLIDSLIVDFVGRGGSDFDQLVISLPGVYPSIAFRSLERLTKSKIVPDQVFIDASRKVLSAHTPINQIPLPQHIILPAQHPLDYDWRFGEAATKRLLDLCLRFSQPNEMITSIGCPTLFHAAINGNYHRRFSLLDANSSIIDCLSKIDLQAYVGRHDVTQDQIPELSAAVVVIDPPWYEEYFRLFIWAACRASMTDAYLLACLPPIGTRPGIEEERDSILKWGKEVMGLELLSLEAGVLPYITPPFEHNALSSEGFCRIPAEWRRGDLAIFKRMGKCDQQRPEVNPSESDWTEETVQGMRVRIKKQSRRVQGFQDPSISSILSGDIMPSVSRRDDRRKLVGVWTSGNRVFSCRGRNTLKLILKSLSTGGKPIEEIAQQIKRRLRMNEERIVLQAANQITEIAALEHEENLARGYP